MDSNALNQAWQACLSLLQKKVQPQSFNTWLKPCHLINDDGESWVIGVPNRFVAGWLENHYIEHILDAIKSTLGLIRNIKFAIDNDGQKLDLPAIKLEPKKAALAEDGSLNDRYTFDSFVVGDSNQFAHAASLAVAEAPIGNKFNPFYIYGGVGLGKTHLAQAIGNFVLETNRNLSVLYVTSEEFTNDFINAIAKQRTADFANRYRSIDLLIIDDIQFLTGKEATQVQFFHTFNALHQNGKQIVLTSDRPPQEIYGIEERLLSRFQSGLVTDIQPPDFEMRLAILNKKIEKEKIEIPPDVAAYIADRVRSNIRELEGLLIRLTACYSLSGRDITINLVNDVLGKKAEKKQRELSLEDIREIVAEYFKVSANQLSGKGKTVEVASARQIAMYISRNHTTYSLKTIGKFYGGRDHSTVIHSINKISEALNQDSLLKFRVDEIVKKLQAA